MVVNLNSKSRKSNFWSKESDMHIRILLVQKSQLTSLSHHIALFFVKSNFTIFLRALRWSHTIILTNYNEMKIRLTHAIEYFLLTAEHFSVLLNCIEVYVQMNIITTFFDTMMAKRAQRETSSPWILCEIKNSILRGEFAVLEIFLYVFFL